MRVHELAKILDVPSQQIIKDLKRYHVSAKNHMSSVDDKVVRKLLNLYEKRRVQAEKKAEEERIRKEEEEKKRKKEEAERKRKEEEERKRKEEAERKKKEEEERKKKEEEKKRKDEADAKKREKDLKRRSSKLTDILQKRQIETRPPRKAAPAKEKKVARKKRPKDKRPGEAVPAVPSEPLAEKQARKESLNIWGDPELTKKYLRLKSKWGQRSN